MRIPLVRIAVACAALLIPAAARAQEGAWPAAMLELEKLALQSPRRNAAFAHLAHLAAECGRLAEWRARWETRAKTATGAEESLLLGWLDIEAGRAKEARVWFARAAEIAPENPHALLAHTESLLRAGEADGEARARRAAELFTDVADKAGALRLAAVVAQEKGEFAAAWAHLRKLEGEPLDAALRMALMPDFARAHLALGDWEKWAAALLESSGKSAADAAACTAACLALGDPATAHRVATEALKRDPADAVLARLAIISASAAGFGGDAAARIEASLGGQPSDDDLAEAVNALATLGAPEHARRIFTRHAARLAPIAARWRQALPLLWNLGATEGLHGVLAPHAAAGGWELQFALGELAIMDKDNAAAEHALWRLFAREFETHEIASTARALATKPMRNPLGFPIAGQGFATRLPEMEQQLEAKQTVFHPEEESAQSWWVNSLTDARDVALTYLRRLAVQAGGDAPEKFLATLRTHTAHWSSEERLLAFTVAGNPAGILDASKAALHHTPVAPASQAFVRSQIARLRALPGLPPELVAQANELSTKLLTKIPVMENSESAGHRLRLHASWKLFEEGKFAEADRQFAETLRVFAAEGWGPDTPLWASFHTSTIHSAAGFSDPKTRADAAACALRWIGMEAPRRADWPQPPQPRMMWEQSENPLTFDVMFQSVRQSRMNFYGPMGERYFASLGGTVPADVLPPLFYFVIKLRGLDEKLFEDAFTASLRDLPEESACTALLCRSVAANFSGSAPEESARLEKLRVSPDSGVARLLTATSELRLASSQPDKPPAGAAALFAKGIPASPVGRAAWLTAALHIISQLPGDADPLPVAQELLRLPLDRTSYTGAKDALELLASRESRPDAPAIRALLEKLTLSWLRAHGTAPLPGEREDHLRTLLDAADADGATELARQMLSPRPGQSARSEKVIAAQRRAILALQTCGELNAWFANLRKTAKADDAAGMRHLAEVSDLLLHTILPTETESPPIPNRPRAKAAPHGGLVTALRNEARESLRKARTKLIELEPEVTQHWSAFREMQQHDGNSRPEDRKLPNIATETLLRAANGGLDVDTAATFADGDLGRIAELVAAWPARPTGYDTRGLAIAGQLWRGGKRDEAVRWLRKLFDSNPDSTAMQSTLRSMLIEALAIRGDTAGVVDLIKSGLITAARPAASIAAFPHLDKWDDYASVTRPLQPMLYEADSLGLGSALSAMLGADTAPIATDLALLLRVQARDLEVLPKMAARLTRPMMPLVLDEFAEQLANWKEGREAARIALGILEHAHAIPSPAERAWQLSRHGLLAARCGMEREAVAWLSDAFAKQSEVRCDRITILLHVTEGMAHCGQPEKAASAARALAEIFEAGKQKAGSGTIRWSPDSVARRIRELAADGDETVVRLLSSALQASDPPDEKGLATAISDATGILASRSGKTEALSPFAWMRERSEDGTGEIAWALGYFPPGKEEQRQMRVPDSPQPVPAKRRRIELFHGEEADRLERIAVIENTASTGVWRGHIPKPGGWLAASATADDAAILGPARAVRTGKNLLPALGEMPGKQLPALLWKKRGAGPGGDTIESVRLPAPVDGEQYSLAGNVIEISGAIGKDLFISGWMKRGSVWVMLADEKEQWQQTGHRAAGGEEGDWQYFEIAIQAKVLTDWGQPHDVRQRRVALKLFTGGAYSGLRVIGTTPAPSADDAARRR